MKNRVEIITFNNKKRPIGSQVYVAVFYNGEEIFGEGDYLARLFHEEKKVVSYPAQAFRQMADGWLLEKMVEATKVVDPHNSYAKKLKSFLAELGVTA